MHHIHHMTGLENHSNSAQRVNNTLLFHLIVVILTRGCFSQTSSHVSHLSRGSCVRVCISSPALYRKKVSDLLCWEEMMSPCAFACVCASAWESTGQSQLTLGGVLRSVHTQRLFSWLHFLWPCLWPFWKEKRRRRHWHFIKWMKSISEALGDEKGEGGFRKRGADGCVSGAGQWRQWGVIGEEWAERFIWIQPVPAAEETLIRMRCEALQWKGWTRAVMIVDGGESGWGGQGWEELRGVGGWVALEERVASGRWSRASTNVPIPRLCLFYVRKSFISPSEWWKFYTSVSQPACCPSSLLMMPRWFWNLRNHWHSPPISECSLP